MNAPRPPEAPRARVTELLDESVIDLSYSAASGTGGMLPRLHRGRNRDPVWGIRVLGGEGHCTLN